MADAQTGILDAAQAMSPAAGSTTYTHPTWYNQTAQGIAGGLAGMTGDQGYINQTMQNWYNAPLSTNYDDNALQAYNQASGANPYATALDAGANAAGSYLTSMPASQGYLGQWNTGLGGTAPMMEAAGAGLTGASAAASDAAKWNATTQQQYMNPYTGGVLNELARLSKQNLVENVMPNVNSTFVGGGQFGSTRNADFLNRAIRENDATLLGQQAKVLMDAQNNAAQQYSDWANKGLTASSQLANSAAQQGNLASTQANIAGQYGNLAAANNALNKGYLDYANTAASLAGAGNAIRQQDFSNLLATSQDYRNWDQAALDRSYKDWQAQRDFPLAALGQTAQAFGGLNAIGSKPDVSNVPPALSQLEGILTAAKVAGELDPTAWQGIWDQVSGLFGQGNATGGAV